MGEEEPSSFLCVLSITPLSLLEFLVSSVTILVVQESYFFAHLLSLLMEVFVAVAE